MTDIEVVIINVLQQLLQKNEILSSESQPVVDLLRQEWINTSEDLQVVLQDESSWQAIQLPVRLKLALQNYITSTNQTETTPILSSTLSTGFGNVFSTRALRLHAQMSTRRSRLSTWSPKISCRGIGAI